MPSIPFQDLQHFVAPPAEYIPERQAKLTIEEIVAAYTPPAPITTIHHPLLPAIPLV